MNIKKNTFLLIGLILLGSCSNNSELEKLKKENSELINKIKELESNKQDFSFIPYSTLDNYSANLGEEINHQVSLAWFNKNEKPLVIYWDQKTKGYTDTIAMDNGISSFLKIKTSKLGENKIEGKVKFKVNGIDKEEMFITTYIVK